MHLWVLESKVDVASGTSANTGSTHAASWANCSGCSDAPLPSSLGDVDGSPRSRRVQSKLGSAGLSNGASRGTTAFLDGACDAAADAEFGYILVVEDNVSLGVYAYCVGDGVRVDSGGCPHCQNL